MDLAVGDLGDGVKAGFWCRRPRRARRRLGNGRLHAGRFGRDEIGVGNSKLRRILELAGAGHDDLETVVGYVGCQSGGRRPRKCTCVGNAVGEAVDWNDVLGWAAQKNN